MEETKTKQIKEYFPNVLGMTESDNNLLVVFPHKEITIQKCEEKDIKEIIKEIEKSL